MFTFLHVFYQFGKKIKVIDTLFVVAFYSDSTIKQIWNSNLPCNVFVYCHTVLQVIKYLQTKCFKLHLTYIVCCSKKQICGRRCRCQPIYILVAHSKRCVLYHSPTAEFQTNYDIIIIYVVNSYICVQTSAFLELSNLIFTVLSLHV